MDPRRTIVLATRNPGKIRELREVLGALGLSVAGLEAHGDIPEPPETGETFAANARDKAAYYARATGQWCLADDSGLVVDALGGEPGVHSARYAADRCPAGAGRDVIDAANNARLLAELRDVADARRTARFVCHLALSDGRRILVEACDSVEGRIGHEPRGHNGFGYDPLFYLPELGCTTAELPSEKKNALSHRGKALRHFARLLADYLKNA
ncbi:MAG TPA: RdgB/HAM1 family non-canonical purine NTP pyrophosphatase [Phycisphaerae bacterium]|nr:RdgB/HAM1 family non-canonical purine NTP pyrophosphatase [Phycisphaerae bacterium]